MRTVIIKNHQAHGIVKDTVLKNGVLQLKVFGNSMSPFIRDGDIIRLQRFENKTLYKGHIIFYQRENRYYMHRIIKKSMNNNNLVFYTRGDSTLSEIERVPADSIIGHVSHLYKNNKFIPIHNYYNRFAALSWYYLLPLRRISRIGRKYPGLLKTIFKKRSHH